MTREEVPQFFERLIAIGELFGAELTEARLMLYFEALSDLTLETALSAMTMAVRSCTFMPKPAELRKFAVGDDEDRVEQAWVTFRRAMRTVGSYCSLVVEDPALAETIVALFGGWPLACLAELSDEMWSSKRKEFGRVFRLYLNRTSSSGTRYLPGVIEAQNAGCTDWLRFVDVKYLEVSGRVTSLDPQEAAEHRSRRVGAATFERIAQPAVVQRLAAAMGDDDVEVSSTGGAR